MQSAPQLAGNLLQYDEPDWRPLESLIGFALADWFMWMHSVLLEDGAVVNAYKHVATRAYFHLAEDGRAFVYTFGGEYREIAPRQAIALVFDGWESLRTQPDDPTEMRAALRRVMKAARDGI